MALPQSGPPKAARKHIYAPEFSDVGSILGWNGERSDYAVLILDLTWAGQTFRVARTDVSIPWRANGNSIVESGVYQYEGLIQEAMSWQSALTLFSSSADTLSFPFSVVLPGVSISQLVEAGYDLLQMTGELSLWRQGTFWDQRAVLLRGRVTDPQYGLDGDPLKASLQTLPAEDRGLVPSAARTINTSTWPNLADNADGQSYPVVFGSQGTAPAAPMSPAYMVDTPNSILLIAGHRVVATSVRIHDSDGNSEVFAVATTTDGLGVTVTTVDISAAASITVADDQDYTVRWDHTSGGGMAAADGSTLTLGGDVLEWLLRQSTLQVDYGRLEAAKPYLNRFKLAGCISEGVSPLDYITANLSPILPMSIVIGPSGIYPIPWRYDAKDRDAVVTIDVDSDPTIDLEGPITYEATIADIVNEFKLRWALSLIGSVTRRSSTLTGTAATADSSILANVYCRESQLRYGVRSMEEESTVIYDSATAALVLAWWALAKALPMRTVTYMTNQSYAWIERGDVVRINDSRVHLSNRLALVDATEFNEDGAVLLTLRIIDDVATTLRKHTYATA